MRRLQDQFIRALLSKVREIIVTRIAGLARDKGVTLTAAELGAIEAQLFDSKSAEPCTGQGSAERVVLNLSDIDWDAEFSAALSEGPEILQRLVSEHLDPMIAALGMRWADYEAEQAKSLEEFRRVVHTRWKEPFRLLGMIATIARELPACSDEETANRPEARHRSHVLPRLHARACQVTEEIRILVSTGFADGAMARWRTLHEIAVVSLFIAQHGEDVAERYTLHEAVETRAILQGLRGREPRLNVEAVTADEMAQACEAVDALVARFHAPFATPYGWAAAALGKERPTLADVELGSNMDHLRPYYKLASHNVHPNPKGAFFRMGVPRHQDTLLAGPSSIGLALPVQSAGISLLQASSAFVTFAPTADSVLAMRVMGALVDQLATACSDVS